MSEWRTIPGFPDYSVSDCGRVLSSRGRWPSTKTHELSPWITPAGYRQLSLRGPSQKTTKMFVHAAVLLAFVGPRPRDLPDIRHLDGNPANNALTNLAYGTRSENQLDKVAHGTHHYSKRDRCNYGHPFSGDNLSFDTKRNRRVCRTCASARSVMFRRRRAGLPVVDLDAYFAEQAA